MRPSHRFAAIALSAALALTGCGSDSDDSSDTTAASDSTAETEFIAGAWVRTTPGGSTMTAGYMNITSPEDDALVGASVDATVADRVELHETTSADGMAGDMEDGETSDMEDRDAEDGEMGDMGEDEMDEMDEMDGSHDSEGDGEGTGAMSMVQVSEITLPAGETVKLEPGGFHLMFIGLPEPLALGDTVDITLDFENADDQTISVEVADSAPAG